MNPQFEELLVGFRQFIEECRRESNERIASFAKRQSVEFPNRGNGNLNLEKEESSSVETKCCAKPKKCDPQIWSKDNIKRALKMRGITTIEKRRAKKRGRIANKVQFQREISFGLKVQEKIQETVIVARSNRGRTLFDRNHNIEGKRFVMEKRKRNSWMLEEWPPPKPPDNGTRREGGVNVKKKRWKVRGSWSPPYTSRPPDTVTTTGGGANRRTSPPVQMGVRKDRCEDDEKGGRTHSQAGSVNLGLARSRKLGFISAIMGQAQDLLGKTQRRSTQETWVLDPTRVRLKKEDAKAQGRSAPSSTSVVCVSSPSSPLRNRGSCASCNVVALWVSPPSEPPDQNAHSLTFVHAPFSLDQFLFAMDDTLGNARNNILSLQDRAKRKLEGRQKEFLDSWYQDLPLSKWGNRFNSLVQMVRRQQNQCQSLAIRHKFLEDRLQIRIRGVTVSIEVAWLLFDKMLVRKMCIETVGVVAGKWVNQNQKVFVILVKPVVEALGGVLVIRANLLSIFLRNVPTSIKEAVDILSSEFVILLILTQWVLSADSPTLRYFCMPLLLLSGGFEDVTCNNSCRTSYWWVGKMAFSFTYMLGRPWDSTFQQQQAIFITWAEINVFELTQRKRHKELQGLLLVIVTYLHQQTIRWHKSHEMGFIVVGGLIYLIQYIIHKIKSSVVSQITISVASRIRWSFVENLSVVKATTLLLDASVSELIGSPSCEASNNKLPPPMQYV